MELLVIVFLYTVCRNTGAPWRLQENKLHQKLIVGTFETHHEKLQKDQSEG